MYEYKECIYGIYRGSWYDPDYTNVGSFPGDQNTVPLVIGETSRGSDSESVDAITTVVVHHQHHDAFLEAERDQIKASALKGNPRADGP